MPRLSLPLLNARSARLNFSLIAVVALLGMVFAPGGRAIAQSLVGSNTTALDTNPSNTNSGVQTAASSSTITLSLGGTITPGNGAVKVVLKGVTTSPGGGDDGGLAYETIILSNTTTGRSMVLLGQTGVPGAVGPPFVELSNATITIQDGNAAAPEFGVGGQAWPAAGGTVGPSSYWNAFSDKPSDIATYTTNFPPSDGSVTLSSEFGGGSTDGNWVLTILNGNTDTRVRASEWDLYLTYSVTATDNTTTSLSSGSNPQNLGGTVTFTATIHDTSNSGTTVGNGTVAFKNNTNGGATLSCTSGNQTVSGGTATCGVSANSLGEGLSTIEADYTPGSGFKSSSGTMGQLVEGTSVASNGNLTWCNTGVVTESGNNTPGKIYPSIIKVTGLGNTVANVQVDLKGVTTTGGGLRASHVLVAPGGTRSLDFLDETFGGSTVSNLNVSFNDTAGNHPNGSAASSGTFSPTDNYQNDSVLPGTIPTATSIDSLIPGIPGTINYAYPHGSISQTFETNFNGATANGDWALYINDISTETETLNGGWCLDFTLNTGVATTTTVTSNANGANFAHTGQAVTITATVKELSNNAVTGGTVTFEENGVAVAGASGAAIPVNGNGMASITTTALSEGDHTIIASYSGDASDNESQGQIIQRVDHVTTFSYNSGVISACNPGAVASTLQPDSTTDGTTGPFTPNPSNIFASQLPGTLQSLTVSLNHLTTGDESIYLTEGMVAGPNGKGLDFFSGTGNSSFGPFGPINVTLSDSGSSQIPQASYSSGIFKPADWDSGTDTFFASSSTFYPLPGTIAQASPHGSSTFATTFVGNDFIGNGTWSLFFNITAKLLQETLANGWCVNFTQNPVATTNALAHSGPGKNGDFVQGEPAAGEPVGSITFNLTNDGVSPNGVGTAGDPVGGNANPLKVVDTLPTGLTYDASANGGTKNGSGWTCSASGQAVTCTNDAASVAVGVAYPQLTIFADVASNASTTTPLSNAVAISGADVTPVASLTDSITVDPAPSLSLSMSHTGTFTQSASAQQTGEWDIQVSDAAASGQTFGTINISDTLPTGYSLQGSSSSSGKFTCGGSGATVTCTSVSGDVIAVGSPETIHLTVVVPSTSAATVTNSACAFGGGDPVHTTCTPTTSGANSNVDTVNVIQVPTTVAINSGNNQSATILTAFTNPLVVTIKDAAGVAIKNYGTISFSAPATEPTGTFSGGASMVTPTADANGQVSETFTAKDKIGNYSVTVMAGSGADTVQNTFSLTNTVGAPASISIVSGNNQSTTVLTGFGAPMVAQVLDVGLNPVPNVVVTFAAPVQTIASLTFAGSVNTATTDASGNATSAGIAANSHAGGPYQVTASASSLQTQFSMTNNPGPATQFIIPGGPEPFYTGFNFTITAEDASGNVATSYNGTVALTSSDPQFANFGPFTLVNGTVSASAILRTAGTDSITATDTINPAITGTGFFIIQPGPANHFGIGTPSSATVGSPISLTVTAYDLGNNVATAYTGTVDFTSTDPSAILPASYTFVAGDNGAHTFQATMVTPGPAQTITATDSANSFAMTSNPINVTIPNLVVNTPGDTAGNCTVQATPGTNSGDTSCSLRDALLESATLGSANITFDSTAFASPTTITLASTLTVPQYTTIQGPTSGSEATLTNLVTVDGGGPGIAAAVFTTNDNAAGIVLQNLIITDGDGSTAGGIFNGFQTSLTLQNCTVSANTSPGGTGGIFSNYNATLVVVGSTISGNSGVVGGISSETGGSITVTNSTLADNNSTSSGGAVNNGGNSITVSDSTISGNSAQFVGGGINTASGTTALANTIVAGNSAGSSNPDVNGGDTDNGGNQIGTAVNLSALGSYGGPTQTMLPLPTSAAICGGAQASIPSGVINDQRGLPNTNTTYPGYSPGTPCVDAGALQTNYAFAITQQPSTSSTTTTLTVSVPISPAPAASVTESGSPVIGATVIIADTDSALSGTTTQTSAAGTATFSGVSIGSAVTGDTLTFTLPLNVSLNMQRVSYPFNAGQPPSLTSPAAGSILPGTSATFTWNPGSETRFGFRLGTAKGLGDLYNSGATTQTSVTVNGLPANAATIYATLSYQEEGTWHAISYTFVEAATPATLLTPTPGSTLTGADVTFTWDPGSGTTFRFRVGTAPLLGDISDTGATTQTSAEVTTLPMNGSRVYATLSYKVHGVWHAKEYTYVASGTPTLPTLLTPAPSSTLTSSDVDFTWDPGTETRFRFRLGTAPGLGDLYDSGETNLTTVEAPGLPTDGSTIYATLSYQLVGGWHAIRYTYTAQ